MKYSLLFISVLAIALVFVTAEPGWNYTSCKARADELYSIDKDTNALKNCKTMDCLNKNGKWIIYRINCTVNGVLIEES